MTDQQFLHLLWALKKIIIVFASGSFLIWMTLAIGLLIMRDYLRAINSQLGRMNFITDAEGNVTLVNTCTRSPGHPNPCNGLPRPDCFPE